MEAISNGVCCEEEGNETIRANKSKEEMKD